MSVVTTTQVLLLFTTLGGDVLSLDDSDEIPRLLDEIFLRLGQDARAWMSQVTTTNTGTEADATDLESYELRESLGLVRLLALFVDDRQLVREQETALPPRWRDQFGAPMAYVTGAKNDRLVRLFPRPDRTVTSPTFDNLKGAPTVIYTENSTARATTIPAQLLLPMTLLLLAREFERESNHRDQDFSSICQALGDSMLTKLQY